MRLRRHSATPALALLVLGLAAGCARPTPIAQTDPDATLRDALRTSVQIAVERNGSPFRWGSGVVISAQTIAVNGDCLVLTSGHTLVGLTAGDAVFALLDRHQEQSVKVRAEVLAAEDTPKWDLALLKIQSRHCVAARAGHPPGLGDSIWVIGFPHGGEMTVGRGIVSQVSRAVPGAPARFTIDASTSHGSSGAGVFDARTGGLIGLVEAFGTARVQIRGGETASQHVDIPMPGMTYVTPVNKIDEFMRAARGAPLLVGRQ
jgi:S1-C subfamily serine protease